MPGKGCYKLRSSRELRKRTSPRHVHDSNDVNTSDENTSQRTVDNTDGECTNDYDADSQDDLQSSSTASSQHDSCNHSEHDNITTGNESPNCTGNSDSQCCDTNCSDIGFEDKIKNWVLDNLDTLRPNVVTELLVLLREEGYRNFPTAAQSFLGTKHRRTLQSMRAGHSEALEGWTAEETAQPGNSYATKATDPHFTWNFPYIASGLDRCANGFYMKKRMQTVSEKYLNKKIKKLMEYFHSEIDGTKQSILHELSHKIHNVKTTTVNNDVFGVIKSINLTDAKTQLGVVLPIDNLDDFDAFEKYIQDEQRRKALMTLYRILVGPVRTAKASIAKIMLSTVTKNVEIHFSGTGRKINGVGKLNFSKTQVFACLQDVMIEKFGLTRDTENLPARVGRWLSGAMDRNGGRRKR